jgi:hypothetical protein
MPLTIYYRNFELQWQKIATKKQNIMVGLRIELRTFSMRGVQCLLIEDTELFEGQETL